jgi:hypothetical protein
VPGISPYCFTDQPLLSGGTGAIEKDQIPFEYSHLEPERRFELLTCAVRASSSASLLVSLRACLFLCIPLMDSRHAQSENGGTGEDGERADCWDRWDGSAALALDRCNSGCPAAVPCGAPRRQELSIG